MTKTKKGPLSQKEKSFIKKNYHSKNAEELASSLKRSVYMVDKFVKTLSFEKEESIMKKPTPEKTIQHKADNLFAKNKERGVVVMTEAASMAADESKAKRKETLTEVAPRYRKYIHKIKE